MHVASVVQSREEKFGFQALNFISAVVVEGQMNAASSMAVGVELVEVEIFSFPIFWGMRYWNLTSGWHNTDLSVLLQSQVLAFDKDSLWVHFIAEL